MPKPTPMGKNQTGRRKNPSKMAKGYAKGGAKKVMTASMGMAAMRSAAKEKGYKLVKMDDKKGTSNFLKRRRKLMGPGSLKK